MLGYWNLDQTFYVEGELSPNIRLEEELTRLYDGEVLQELGGF